MYTVHIKDKTYEIEFQDQKNNCGSVNGQNFVFDQISEKNGSHVIFNNRSYNVKVIRTDMSEKKITLSINNEIIEAVVFTELDKLVKTMGFKNQSAEKSLNLKAPMPGLVTDIKVKKGDSIQKGDSLIVLEAMKMENNLKAENDSIVKDVIVKKGSTVEKNEVLIIFE